MNEVVTEFISGFLLIMGFAIFYVLWDNSCKKFQEFEKLTIERLNALDFWMNAVEESLESNNVDVTNIKKFRKEYNECKSKIVNCVKNP